MAKKKFVKVILRSTGEVLVERARWCESRLCRLRGLQFHRRLRPGEGMLLVKAGDSTLAASIHMFGVFFSIAAIWIDSQGCVTSTQLAKPWRPYYASPRPARYILETTPAILARVAVGDQIDFVPL